MSFDLNEGHKRRSRDTEQTAFSPDIRGTDQQTLHACLQKWGKETSAVSLSPTLSEEMENENTRKIIFNKCDILNVLIIFFWHHFTIQ